MPVHHPYSFSIRCCLLTIGCWLLTNQAFSQMSVTTTGAAATLAQAIAGGGVTVSNTTINCGGNAAGLFTFSGPDLGLTGGIILTTGTASQAANPGSFLCSVTNGNNFSDPNLTAIVPTATFDVCILEFDFIPVCDSLTMKYVFGSEEYPTGVGGYNDAFAIFLTGANPAGGNYTAQNIALLPNGTAVSINNVNATTNTAYFHNNYTTPNSDVAYNGYTIPITSITPVMPCSTYHMKIAIADAGNPLYDSGVFISNNGISCQNTPTITVSSSPTSGCTNTGSATVTVTNYTGTPTYHWLPGGQNTATIGNLAAGTYTCLVGTHQACGIVTQTVTTSVATSGSNLVLTSSQQTLTCNGGSNASATVTPIGGTSPYTCVWNTTPVQNGLTASNLPAGTYTATVNDNGGCVSSIAIHITAPPAMQTSVTSTPTTCTASIGTASVVVVSNGTSPYSYAWNTTPPQNTQTATNLAQGVYNVTITDAHSCTVTAVATINTQAISWSLTAATPTNVVCNGESNGAVAATINNPGSNTFNYTWNTSPPQNSLTASNIPAGNYTCTVSDENGCVLTTTVIVTQPNALTSSISGIPTMCAGSVGSATVIPSGGTSPMLYVWSTTPTQTTNITQGLAQGSYTVVITDAHHCKDSSTVVINTVYPTLQITESVTKSICGGPSGAIMVTGVTPNSPPYSYSWNTGQTTNPINNLMPGTYTVSITDNNGCTGSASVTVGITTFFPISINTSPDYCNKSIGSATATPFANPPYQYHWNTIPVQTTQTASNLPAGNYTVQVTDAYGCKDSVQAMIGVLPSLTVQVSTTPTYCNKNYGTATANAVGYQPYQYTWTTIPSEITQTATYLFAGNYTVYVTDAYGCAATATTSIININDVLTPVFETNPSGNLYSQNPITITIQPNAGWTLTNAYLSDGDSINALSVIHTFQQSGDYTATYYFTSNHGCVDIVIYNILIIDYSTLYIPNTFTPNNDGKNDVFRAEGTFITSFEMFIYDRWGNLVISLEDLTAGWNGSFKGKEAPEDVYVYKGTATDISGKQLNFKGQINLIR
ncbi:MAG: choice-of-anchor L domain-containing protein [Bacteroidia bacterium]